MHDDKKPAPTMVDEHISVAYHEASHAVAAIVLDIPFCDVTIVPNDDYAGAVNYGIVTAFMNVGHRRFRAEIRDRLVCNRAGQIGALRFTGASAEGIEDDDDLFWSTLWTMYGKRSERHASMLTREAHYLVGQHWAEIERVATALIEHRTLTQNQVGQLVALDEE